MPHQTRIFSRKSVVFLLNNPGIAHFLKVKHFDTVQKSKYVVVV